LRKVPVQISRMNIKGEQRHSKQMTKQTYRTNDRKTWGGQKDILYFERCAMRQITTTTGLNFARKNNLRII